MNETLAAFLRRRAKGFVRFNLPRLVIVVAIALFLQTASFAYTLVLRSGRRAEIPANFVVTESGVTYETAPNIIVTVQLSGIDIAATERANHETIGSFLRRIEQHVSMPERSSSFVREANAAPTQTRRQITNKDLEGLRRKRESSERLYEQRRAQSGLPSSEELRRRREDESARAREQLRRDEAIDAQSESYWRARASTLRAESAALEAQINYVESRLAELPSNSLFMSPENFVAIGSPLGSYGYPYGTLFPYGIANNTGIYGANTGAQLSGRFSIGGGRTRVGIGINAPQYFYGSSGTLQRRVIVAPGLYNSPLLYASMPYSYYPYDQSTGRNDLLARLRELEEARAGLRARWQLLEDEARRAGAVPGWLRP